MEEDIKILKEETNALGLFFKCKGTEKYKKAIENLIKRNKELEKLELEHKKINGMLREKIKELEHKYQRALSDLVIAENTKHTCPYIPTSGVTCKAKEFEAKIKEKIEEINSRIEKYREYTEQGIETDVEWVDNVADRETVQVLQELLEE